MESSNSIADASAATDSLDEYDLDESSSVDDGTLAPDRYLDRELKQLDPLEFGLLRLGIYELSQRIDIPYRVVINEAVELAKSFGGTEGFKYVNGVLDRVAAQLRPAEVAARG